MIEEKVREYLEDKLDIPVRMEEEPGLPEEYVLIEKTGSGEENHIASATLAIQSYSGSLYEMCIRDRVSYHRKSMNRL